MTMAGQMTNEYLMYCSGDFLVKPSYSDIIVQGTLCPNKSRNIYLIKTTAHLQLSIVKTRAAELG